MSAHIDVILRARMQSGRLPGKVMMPAADKPLLLHMVERIRRVRFLNRIVVATSEDRADDPIAELCDGEGILCFRGNREDVLDRLYRCALEFKMDPIAILGADNPLIDPEVCDDVIDVFLTSHDLYDYVSNFHQSATFPDGQEIEVCSLPALQAAWQEADMPFQREHGTPFIWDQPERFRCFNVSMEPNLHHERWTLDYVEDYELIRTIFDALYPINPIFSMWDIVRYLDAHPALRNLNAMHGDYSWHTEHLDALKTIRKDG